MAECTNRDLHLGELLDSANIELGVDRVPSGRAAVKAHLVVVDVAQEAEFRRTECLKSVGIGLRGIPRPIDFIVQNNQDAFPTCLRRHRGADRIEQVERAVCADCRGRAHGGRHTDRPKQSGRFNTIARPRSSQLTGTTGAH